MSSMAKESRSSYMQPRLLLSKHWTTCEVVGDLANQLRSRLSASAPWSAYHFLKDDRKDD